MYELSVACKYLIPRWRQLSVSIISLISMIVIALVVWLIVVFFSVKDGLENSWIDKLIALTAPIRITPTEKYYNSYYYLSDSISTKSDYTLKTVGEKLLADAVTSYDSTIDEEPPSSWMQPDLNETGELKDLVKLAFNSASQIPEAKNVMVSDYELTAANLKLRMLRPSQSAQSQQFLEQATYIGSFNSDTAAISRALIPPTADDINNLLRMQRISTNNIQENSSRGIVHFTGDEIKQRLKNFFLQVQVKTLKTPLQGWRIPSNLLPSEADLVGAAIYEKNKVVQVLIPKIKNNVSELILLNSEKNISIKPVKLKVEKGVIFISEDNHQFTPFDLPITLEANTSFAADVTEDSIHRAVSPQEIRFQIQGIIQGYPISGIVALNQLEIDQFKLSRTYTPSFTISNEMGTGIIPGVDPKIGEGIIIPRSFKEGGVLVGDQGFLSYYSPTPSTIQEQRIPVYVSGFYDPGIMPMGGKFILASHHLAGLIRASHDIEEALIGNGLNIHFENISDAPKVKAALMAAFRKAGIDAYWKVETYQEYEFTKDLIQQLQSEKNLFSLISMVIIIVACSNIISMLIILVNDKKVEIGILRSMGAHSGSIALIFGLCGMVMGGIGSFIGILAAVVTLQNLESLVNMIGQIQGHDLFNPVFYGNTLPNEISFETLGAVVFATALISLLAGIIPAVKASLMRPSTILRSE